MTRVIELNWVKLLKLGRLWVLLSKLEEDGLIDFFSAEDKMDQLKDAEFHLTYNSQELVITWEELNNIREFLIESAKVGEVSNAASKLIRELTQNPGTDRDGAIMSIAFHLMSVIDF